MGEDPTTINQFLDLIFSYGVFWVYLVIFIACFIENIFPPFPGDSFIIGAGLLAGVHRIDLAIVMPLIIGGGMISVMLIYLFGRNYGREFFVRKNYKYFSSRDIEEVEGKFSKYGGLILVFSRFVVGFRSALALVAGISRYKAGLMFLYSLVSYVLFSSLLVFLSYKLVENIDLLEYYFETYNKIVWPILIILIVVFIITKYLKLRKRQV